MIFDPEKHYRRCVYPVEYEFSEPGAYFITICSWLRGFIFGEIINGNMELNEYGMIVEQAWRNNKHAYPHMDADYFIVMPNHIHVIMNMNRRAPAPAPDVLPLPKHTLGSIISAYKNRTTRQINIIRNTPGMPVWQRTYFEHMIRNDIELHKIRDYIMNNPVRWAFDKDNPLNIQVEPS